MSACPAKKRVWSPPYGRVQDYLYAAAQKRAKRIGILLAQVICTVSHSFRRVRLIRWAFTHPHGDKIEYSVQTHQAGLELRVTLNAELLHLQVFSGPDELARVARESGNRLEARGWLHQADGEALA